MLCYSSGRRGAAQRRAVAVLFRIRNRLCLRIFGDRSFCFTHDRVHIRAEDIQPLRGISMYLADPKKVLRQRFDIAKAKISNTIKT